MLTGTKSDRAAGVPAGYAAVPVELAGPAAAAVSPVRVCVLVRREPDPVAGRFVIVRQSAVGRAVLGCLTDAASNVMDWLEVWIQAGPTAAAGGPPSGVEATNGAADRRWDAFVDAFARLGKTGGFLASGWESAPGRPLILEPDLARIAPPKDPQTGDAWVVCADEAVLAAAALPGYAATAHRYLHLPGRAGSKLVPVTPDAPPSAQTTPMPAVTDGRGFNVEGGRMLLLRHGPIPVTAMFDVLGGRPWRGVGHGAGTVPLVGSVESLRTAAATEGTVQSDEGRLFLGRHGRWGRVVESYHLRVRLLADMVAAVRQAVVVTGRPLLSVGPDSFQVRLPEPSAGLPFLWEAQVTLADPGQAVRAEVPGSDLVFYRPPPAAAASIYRSGSGAVAASTGGTGTIRVRQVFADAAKGAVVEGTLATPEPADRADGQLLWMRPTLASGPVDLYARLTDGATAGEWRFRTVGQRLSTAAVAELQAAAGVPVGPVPFATVPVATTAADLHALAVLAVQALLADATTFPLPIAVDDVMSLARELASHHDPDVGLSLRVRAVFEADRRWLATLGPQRLIAEPMTPQQALELIPIELWCDTLAMIVRMFPGLGPDSTCRTWDDAAAAAVPHRPFEPTAADLDGLIRRSRSLIVIDWKYNREVRAAIRTRMGQAGARRA